jgi:hypothetical protein
LTNGNTMRVAFHLNELTVRGTGVAVYDYARFNETFFENSSVILHHRHLPTNDSLMVERFMSRFVVIGYDNPSQIDQILRDQRADRFYVIKSGEHDGIVARDVPTLVHAVFQTYQPHGNVYAYVSQWLSEKMTGGTAPWVSHIVDLPAPTRSLRPEWDIPITATVFGRIGGSDQFDLPFAQRAVDFVSRKRPDIYFVFVNTTPFCPRRRNIIHLSAGADPQWKSNVIASCDAMIHARAMGESFGLAIAEFCFLGKPVVAWEGGKDQNHREMLGNQGIYYQDEMSCALALLQFDPADHPPEAMTARVRDYTPEIVMEKFSRVFLRA